jgi:hypothetical protein
MSAHHRHPHQRPEIFAEVTCPEMTERSRCEDSRTAMLHSADMSNARFPQRFVERTVDYLHPDPGALKVGCLIKKTRVAGSRYHHFYEKIVNGSLELDTWMGAFVYPVRVTGFVRRLHVAHPNMLEGRVPWGMPNLLTGLLITALITVTNCAEAEGSNGLLVTLVVPATRGCPCGTEKLIYR